MRTAAPGDAEDPGERVDATSSFERSPGAVRLAGTFCTREAARTWSEIHDAAKGGGELVLDLSDVRRMDGGVIALLVAARAELAAEGVSVRIVSIPEA
ncbi:MAG: STAS domain-containing protein, partial [Labilithrix sp.]|nr:STAS domain-containing protein [Labilithrix sp.]